ncbi:hypothetical protein BD770DRAFT_186465 [Pilaira anomala]|nr:hypothetical protein BD770DRAFT_186465 [Pilaira anomala]
MCYVLVFRANFFFFHFFYFLFFLSCFMTYTLCRHASLLNGSKPAQLEHWLQERQCRSVSVPDLGKLKVEWDRYQHSDTYHSISETQMQVDLLNIRMDSELKRPQIRVKMGPSQYVSRRSKVPTGDWNEGFLFVVSYHAQLFNTIEFDLYDKPHKHWPSTRHVGKAKLKLSSLSNKEDVFVTFLPIYEYQLKRTLSAELQQLDDDMSSSISSSSWVEPHHHKKTELIGSLQIRVRYKFQYPAREDEATLDHHRLVVPVPTRSPEEETRSIESLCSVDSEKTVPIGENTFLQVPMEDPVHPLSSAATHRSSYGRGDLVQEENYIHDDLLP